MVDDALDCLGKQIEEKISASTSILCDLNSVQPEVQQDEDLLSAAHLKKKEVQQKKFKTTHNLARQDTEVHKENAKYI